MKSDPKISQISQMDLDKKIRLTVDGSRLIKTYQIEVDKKQNSSKKS